MGANAMMTFLPLAASLFTAAVGLIYALALGAKAERKEAEGARIAVFMTVFSTLFALALAFLAGGAKCSGY
jgi:hypothetical protein